MKRTSVILMALAFGGMTAIVYTAQGAASRGSEVVASADRKDVQSAGGHLSEPGGQNDPLSAEKHGTATGGTVKAAGGHPEEPGGQNDPLSAEKHGTATGGNVKAAGPHAEEPGRSNDPASAEKKQ
jgi:hypothetical protein